MSPIIWYFPSLSAMAPGNDRRVPRQFDETEKRERRRRSELIGALSNWRCKVRRGGTKEQPSPKTARDRPRRQHNQPSLRSYLWTTSTTAATPSLVVGERPWLILCHLTSLDPIAGRASRPPDQRQPTLTSRQPLHPSCLRPHLHPSLRTKS